MQESNFEQGITNFEGSFTAYRLWFTNPLTFVFSNFRGFVIVYFGFYL